MILTRRTLVRTLAALSLAPPLTALAKAALAKAAPLPGPQATTEGATVRLLAGRETAGIVQAGLELRLEAGWKTYWRYPGDSGVPPRFDWSGAQNVASVTVGWPAPRRFSDGSGGFSIGYKDTVILPLTVRLADPGKPALLDLNLDFAVCQALCVPAQARLALALPGTGADDPSLAAARALMPVETALGAPGPLSVQSVSLDSSRTPPQIIVTAKAGAGATLLLEGPDEGWALPLPEPAGAAGANLRFAAPLLGVPSDAPVTGNRLRLTLIEGTRAIETLVPLPPLPARR